jgi:hypothetical protein
MESTGQSIELGYKCRQVATDRLRVDNRCNGKNPNIHALFERIVRVFSNVDKRLDHLDINK